MSTTAAALAPRPGVSALTRVLAIALAVFTVLFSVPLILAAASYLDQGGASSDSNVALAVSAPPTISVRLASGTLDVASGSPGEVRLIEHDSARGLTRGAIRLTLRRLRATMSAQGDAVTVIAPDEVPTLQSFSAGPISEKRDLTLRIPPGSSLRLDSGPGLIRLRGLRGPVDVTGSAGIITLDSFVVSGASRLRISSGGIAGTILMAGGSLDASVVGGGIRLRVAAGDGTRVQASTANGSVNVGGDLHLTTSKLGSSAAASGVIGGGPAADGALTLSVVNGSIDLHGS